MRMTVKACPLKIRLRLATAAGRRRVVMLPHVLPEVERHLETWVKAGPGALVFTSEVGDPPAPVHCPAGAGRGGRAAGVEHLRFHDLRHTDQHPWAAATGASTKKLMARIGARRLPGGADLAARQRGARSRHRRSPLRDGFPSRSRTHPPDIFGASREQA
jgi:hypothetical protein